MKSFISEESDIICAFSHNYEKIKLNIYDSLPLEKKIISLHNVIILIKSVFNKNQSHYYYHIFLEKCSYQIPKK